MAGRAERRSYHHGDLKRALTDAALELVAECGPRGFTLSEAARRAGVSVAAPYRHFTDKQALLARVAEQGFVALRDRLEKAGPDHDAAERLRRVSAAYVRFALENRDQYAVMIGAELDKTAHPELAGAGDAAFGVLLDALAQCQREGLLPGDDPRLWAAPAWAMVHGLSSLVIDGALGSAGIEQDPEETALGFVTLLLGQHRTPTAEVGGYGSSGSIQAT